mmetsp:Transcript_48660/g.112652  ORF Transcript_48660/g.112652 Transcript_48660/m.112652 type:complete len:335 (+) Transcript_48660:550-1554(+)
MRCARRRDGFVASTGPRGAGAVVEGGEGTAGGAQRLRVGQQPDRVGARAHIRAPAAPRRRVAAADDRVGGGGPPPRRNRAHGRDGRLALARRQGGAGGVVDAAQPDERGSGAAGACAREGARQPQRRVRLAARSREARRAAGARPRGEPYLSQAQLDARSRLDEGDGEGHGRAQAGDVTSVRTAALCESGHQGRDGRGEHAQGTDAALSRRHREAARGVQPRRRHLRRPSQGVEPDRIQCALGCGKPVLSKPIPSPARSMDERACWLLSEDESKRRPFGRGMPGISLQVRCCDETGAAHPLSPRLFRTCAQPRRRIDTSLRVAAIESVDACFLC